MTDAKPTSTPMDYKHQLTAGSPEEHEEVRDLPYQSLMGSLLYVAIATHPDIAYTVANLCKYNLSYTQSHWIAAKQVLHYVQGTRDLQLTYHHEVGLQMESMMQISPKVLIGFTDTNWAGDLDTCHSTSRYTFLLGGGAISWGSKTQTSPALSSTEAEYVGATCATQEALWLRQMLFDLGIHQSDPTRVWCDNQSSIALSSNPGSYARTKHIAI